MATHAEDKATAMATQAGDKAEQVGDSKALEVLARVGLVAYGVVHLLLGWLALQIAWGLSGRESADTSGAMKTLADQPGGAGLVWLLRHWCPMRPSPTCATTCGSGSGIGCVASTPRPPGRTSAAATSAADRGRPATAGYCSTPPRSAPAATATGAQPSRHPGRPPHSHHQADPPGTYREPVAVKVARRVREAVRGNGPVEKPAPRPGPTSQRPTAASGAAAATAAPNVAGCRAGSRQDSASTDPGRARQRVRGGSQNRW